MPTKTLNTNILTVLINRVTSAYGSQFDVVISAINYKTLIQINVFWLLHGSLAFLQRAVSYRAVLSVSSSSTLLHNRPCRPYNNVGYRGLSATAVVTVRRRTVPYCDAQAQKPTRHRASTSMYSLTFRFHVMLP